MRAFGVVAALLTAVSLAASLALLVGLDAVRVAGFLAGHGALPYALALWWVLLAPVPLALAALVAGRAPWLWVGVTTLHLAVLVAVATRLRHLLDAPTAAALVVVVVLAVTSLGLAVQEPPDRRTPARRRAW